MSESAPPSPESAPQQAATDAGKLAPRSIADLPKTTPPAETFAKQLVRDIASLGPRPSTR